MRISRENLLAQVTSKDDSRPVLTGICFDEGGSVSADGYRLLFVPYPIQDDALAAKLPEAARAFAGHHTAILPRAACERIGKALKRNRPDIPIGLAVDGEKATITIVGDEGTTIEEVALVGGQFPHWRKIGGANNGGKPTVSVALGVNLLLDTLEQIKKSGALYAWFRVWGQKDPVTVEAGGEGSSGAHAVVMPFYVQDPDPTPDARELIADLLYAIENGDDVAARTGSIKRARALLGRSEPIPETSPVTP